MQEPRFDIEVQLDLSGPDGNIFVVMGWTRKAIRQAAGSQEQVEQYMREVTSCDSYERALEVTREWINLYDSSR